MQKTNSRILGAISEGIIGVKITKALVVEERNLREFQQLTGKMYKSCVMAERISAIYMPIVLTLGSISTAFVLWHGGNQVLLKVISYESLVAFLIYTVQFFEPVTLLARLLAELISAQASGERIISLIETEPDIANSVAVVQKYGDMLNPKKRKLG